MNGKKGFLLNPVDAIAGVLLVLGGLSTLVGRVNLGVVFAGLGLLIEAIKIVLRQGL